MGGCGKTVCVSLGPEWTLVTRKALLIATLAAVIATSGCTALGIGTSTADDAPTRAVAERPSPDAVAAEPERELTPAEEATAAVAADDRPPGYEECKTTVFAEPGDPIQIAGWKPEIPVDQGAREKAMGTVEVNADGVPVAYTVAPGDVPEIVSDRFCVHLAYLHAINSVRRVFGANNRHPGDVINFDAATIGSVGSERGEVANGPYPEPHPPQR